jgi:phosphatidylserine/phosphatidylglycerophosphate/cardiolipin synthase-like enzyme
MNWHTTPFRIGMVTASLLLMAWLLGTQVFAGMFGAAEQQAHARIETGALRGYRGAWYQAYFTNPVYPEEAANRENGMDEALVADIAHAQHSIALASFDLDLPSVANALIAAHARSVAVQVTIDGENLTDPMVAAVLGELEDAGVSVFYDRRSAFMHNKIVVIDEHIVWSGSWNLTANDTFRNNNNMLRIEHGQLAITYRARLDQIHAGDGGSATTRRVQRPTSMVGAAPVRAMFAPVDPVTQQIIEQIRVARIELNVLAFAFTSDSIAQALVDARARGVHVRVVMERRNSAGTGSEFAALRAAGVDVLVDGNCFVMHHKVMIIDGKHTITGSFNFTDAAQAQNDENVLLTDDASVAALYNAEFERVYNQALNPTDCEE